MLYIQSNGVPRDLHKGVALSSTDKIAARRLYSLAGAWPNDGDGDPLNLRFAPSTDHFKRKRVLANKILGRAINRDESRKLKTKALFYIGGAQAALHLAVALSSPSPSRSLRQPLICQPKRRSTKRQWPS
jgi:hypothetical protein